MSLTDFYHDFWDFGGNVVFSATAASNVGHPFRITDTSAVGAVTHAVVDGAANAGEVAIAMEATSEVQNICLDFGDVLVYDIDKLVEVEFGVKMNQAAMDTASMFAFGMTGDRNDVIDTIAQALLFRVIGADSTTNVVVESDDGTNEVNDGATGQTLINAYKKFKISLATGKSDVRFFIDGQPVNTASTHSMAAYTGALQPAMQIQKTADTNTDGFTVDYISVRGRR